MSTNLSFIYTTRRSKMKFADYLEETTKPRFKVGDKVKVYLDVGPGVGNPGEFVGTAYFVKRAELTTQAMR